MPKRPSKSNPSGKPILTRVKKKTYSEKSVSQKMKDLNKLQRGGKR